MGCSRTGMPIHWWMSIQFLHINTTLMLVPCTSESLGLDHCRDQTLTDKRTSPMNFFFHYVWSHGFVGGTYLTFCYFNNATTPILDWMRTTQYSFLSTLQIYLSLGSSIRRVSTFAVISLWSWFSQSFKYTITISFRGLTFCWPTSFNLRQLDVVVHVVLPVNLSLYHVKSRRRLRSVAGLRGNVHTTITLNWSMLSQCEPRYRIWVQWRISYCP